MEILLVENEAPLALALERALIGSGMMVHHESNGSCAASRAVLQPFSLVVLDLDLPDLSGFEVMRRMRVAGSTTPVLLLASREAAADRAGKLHFGADGYLTKPFVMAEFETRVQALLGRGRPCPGRLLHCRGLVLDTSTGATWLNCEPITLRRQERMVLQALLGRAGHIVTREQLCAELGNSQAAPQNVLELYVARLRKKLAGGPEIRTVRGAGYLIMAG